MQITDKQVAEKGIGRATLETLDPNQRVRITRTIVFEGPAVWVEQTLIRSTFPNGVGPTRVQLAPDRSITCTGEDVEIL